MTERPRIPRGLEWRRSVPGGAAWLDRLPGLVAECADRWRLEVAAPFEPASVSFVAAARLMDGSSAVLKVNFPEPESEREGDALRHWAGEGAVRLLAEDESTGALLVERCLPGTALWEVEDEEEAFVVVGDLLSRLWKPAPAEHRFRELSVEAERWIDEIPADWERLGRPYERELVETAVGTLAELATSQGEPVVAHQDLHGGNILRSERKPWLAIDPKPLVGEREFDTASLLRDRRDELVRDPAAERRVRRRLDQLAGDLGLDRERMRGWGIAHALAWCAWPDRVDPQMVACARWLAAA